jgi:hypothetical protein
MVVSALPRRPGDAGHCGLRGDGLAMSANVANIKGDPKRYPTTTIEHMECFDSLPPEARALLSCANQNYAVEPCYRILLERGCEALASIIRRKDQEYHERAMREALGR